MQNADNKAWCRVIQPGKMKIHTQPPLSYVTGGKLQPHHCKMGMIKWIEDRIKSVMQRI